MRVLLLDFDGVLLRNPHVNRYVGNACTRWLADRTRQSYAQARKANKAHGHTSIVLQKVYKIPCSVEVFNQEVYKRYLSSEVMSRLLARNADADKKEAGRWVERIIQPWQQTHGPNSVFVFSNAPTAWCKTLMRALGTRDAIPDACYMGSNTLGALKPYWQAYLRATEAVKQLCPDARHIVFVDDHIPNLTPIHMNPTLLSANTRWEAIHYPAHHDVVALESTLMPHFISGTHTSRSPI
jgi:phosphoglycolate phosphatase-like HAD superfamily hydrolase